MSAIYSRCLVDLKEKKGSAARLCVTNLRIEPLFAYLSRCSGDLIQ